MAGTIPLVLPAPGDDALDAGFDAESSEWLPSALQSTDKSDDPRSRGYHVEAKASSRNFDTCVPSSGNNDRGYA